jgi:hypothetical protein
MLTVVAFVVVQVKVDDWPAVIVSGDAFNVAVGRPPPLTVTVAVLVIDPAALLAVSVYVVVAAGDTVLVPDAATVPMP